jgi:predicted nucleic acid-binding protein
MLALFDTNTALDWLVEREPWYSDAVDFWALMDSRRLVPYLAAISVTNIHYIVRRITDNQNALAAVRKALSAFTICPVDSGTLLAALTLPGSDYEDHVQIICAQRANLDVIVTRDPVGFRPSPIPVLTPADVVARLAT